MPDEGKDPTPDPPNDGGTNGDAGGNDDPQGEVARLRAELAKARKWEAQAKANADKAKRFDTLEEEKKTAEEKAAEARKLAEDRAAAAELAAARLRIAMKKGLTEAQSRRLVGTTDDELEADADELLASFRAPEDEGQGGGELQRRPQERLRPGSVPDSQPKFNPKEIADKVTASRIL